MNEAYLCLGGNLGDCFANLRRACLAIDGQLGRITAKSALYRSQAWYMENAPDFLNQVIKLETNLPARQLLKELQAIEKEMGRTRTEGNGYQNRTIDIDILFFNDEVIRTNQIEIPHPRLHVRKFVLIPLQEIAANRVHPKFGKTINELVDLCSDMGTLKKQTDVS